MKTPTQLEISPTELAWLASGDAVRERCHAVYRLAEAGGTAFSVHPEKLGLAAERVIALIRRDYPTGKIPFHARWVHFEAGGLDRIAILRKKMAALDPTEQTRALLDLATVSVLLDAGAGPQWGYDENGQRFIRSEGLAVASFHSFLNGRFSSDPQKHPFRVDGQRLQTLTPDELATDFQVSEKNPLVGLETRAQLLNRLGETLRGNRPSFLLDRWRDLAARSPNGKLRGNDVLREVLLGFQGAWSPKIVVNQTNFGDAWEHPGLSGSRPLDRILPFHKLSQWLSYSLMEPVMALGIGIERPDDLTGLPEYRNGGLFLDLGILVPRDARALDREHRPEDLFIIEWRALTVALLDRLAEEVRARLKLTPEEFPLVKLLQAGTWQAGREVAAEKRAGGPPPLKILSDGTVF